MDYILDYLNYIKYERKLSSNTYQSYKYNLDVFYDYFKDDNIIKLDRNNIQDFLYQLDLSSRSKAHYLTVINSFYKYLVNDNVIDKSPAEGIKMPKMPKTLPEYLSLEEVDKLLDIKLIKPHDYRNKAMLEVLYATGIRISELVNLKLFQIDFLDSEIRIMGKGKKERITPLNDMAIKYLKLYINDYRSFLLKEKQSEYVFINNLGNNISRQGFYKILKKLAKEGGVTKNISPHILRHSFATHMLNNGADLRIIQEILGHENLSTTEIYAKVHNKKIKEDYSNHPHS